MTDNKVFETVFVRATNFKVSGKRCDDRGSVRAEYTSLVSLATFVITDVDHCADQRTLITEHSDGHPRCRVPRTPHKSRSALLKVPRCQGHGSVLVGLR